MDELLLLLGSLSWACVFSFFSASSCARVVFACSSAAAIVVYGSSTFFGNVVLDGFLLFLYGKRREGG